MCKLNVIIERLDIELKRQKKLANIDLNDNVSDNDSNIDDSEEEELQVSLNTGSDGKAREEDDSNIFMEMASNEKIF